MSMPLKERLLVYLQKRPTEWVASGDLQRLTAQHTSYTPQNAGRRLRELQEEGVLDVEYRHGHAFYRIHQNSSVNWDAYNREVLKAFEEA